MIPLSRNKVLDKMVLTRCSRIIISTFVLQFQKKTINRIGSGMYIHPERQTIELGPILSFFKCPPYTGISALLPFERIPRSTIHRKPIVSSIYQRSTETKRAAPVYSMFFGVIALGNTGCLPFAVLLHIFNQE